MEHYKFLSHPKCEFFPCHKGLDPKQFNCLFCYCPLYALGSDCGGNFTFTQDGLKDCSNCLIPHAPQGYEHVTSQYHKIAELIKENSKPL